MVPAAASEHGAGWKRPKPPPAAASSGPAASGGPGASAVTAIAACRAPRGSGASVRSRARAPPGADTRSDQGRPESCVARRRFSVSVSAASTAASATIQPSARTAAKALRALCPPSVGHHGGDPAQQLQLAPQPVGVAVPAGEGGGDQVERAGRQGLEQGPGQAVGVRRTAARPGRRRAAPEEGRGAPGGQGGEAEQPDAGDPGRGEAGQDGGPAGGERLRVRRGADGGDGAVGQAGGQARVRAWGPGGGGRGRRPSSRAVPSPTGMSTMTAMLRPAAASSRAGGRVGAGRSRVSKPRVAARPRAAAQASDAGSVTRRIRGMVRPSSHGSGRGRVQGDQIPAGAVESAGSGPELQAVAAPAPGGADGVSRGARRRSRPGRWRWPGSWARTAW